jgi:hypothetical protein
LAKVQYFFYFQIFVEKKLSTKISGLSVVLFPLLLLTWWHIAEVAASQHAFNASLRLLSAVEAIPRGKAAILAICSLEAGGFSRY